ncbi:MAG TPA: YciI family protein [Flavisolibacter sp.]|nr:YciI family protein [Flavisolibacter sp.]
MKEFLFLIRTQGDHFERLTPQQQQSHLQKVGGYIGKLVQEGKMKSAQPLEMEGAIIFNRNGKLKDGPFNETKEVIAGYFLIEAESLQDAMDIARMNPVFEDETARVEVRPIKKMEGIN